MKTITTIAITILTVMFTQIVHTAPSINLCMEENCRQTHKITISFKTWKEIESIFASHSNSDIDEQDNLLTSIKLIEHDIYSQLAESNHQTKQPGDIYTSNSEKLNYKNLRRILGVLLDNHLVERHFLRHTIRSNHWRGQKIDGLVIQSLTDSRLYVLSKDTSNLNAPFMITDYSTQKSSFKPAATNNTPIEDAEDSFE